MKSLKSDGWPEHEKIQPLKMPFWWKWQKGSPTLNCKFLAMSCNDVNFSPIFSRVSCRHSFESLVADANGEARWSGEKGEKYNKINI